MQGSIDATSTPLTEEEAFRQNLGRELGPIGSLKPRLCWLPWRPAAPADFFASPLIGALRNGLPWLPAGARIAGRGAIAGQGANGPIVAGLEGRFPEAVNWLRKAGTGDAPGVLSHPELRDRRVDLIFGKRGERGYGVDHIDADHPGDLDKLPDVWPSMAVRVKA